MHQFLTVAMTSRSAAKLKAVDQARSKLEELTKYDYPCFTFMLTELRRAQNSWVKRISLPS